MHYRKTLPKDLNVGHIFLQPSWISMKLGRVIPIGILHTCGDFCVKRSKVKVIMHNRKTNQNVKVGHTYTREKGTVDFDLFSRSWGET